MTSKRKGRDWQHQKDRKRWAIRLRNDDPHPCARCGAVDYHGYEWDLGHPEGADLARVADAAREQGRREGWTQAWAAGARADEDAYRRGWDDAVADATLAAGDDATPEDAKPAGGEVNRFSADGPCCGFACCCQHPPVVGWTPGSVTR